MVKSPSVVTIFFLALLVSFIVGTVAVLFAWLFQRLKATERISSGTAGKLDELVDLIKKVGAGEGGETQLGPAKPQEGDKEGDLLWGDHAEWVDQERKKTGWKDRQGKVN